MPFKPLSNALLSPYKVPFGVYLYNYLITNNLRRLLNNSFFSPTPHIYFAYFVNIFWWVVGGEWWVLMASIKFIVNPHIIITQHPSPNIQSHTSSTPNTQHSTFITQHPTPITQHSTPHIINTQHSSPNTQHSTPHIINTQHPTPNTQHFPPH